MEQYRSLFISKPKKFDMDSHSVLAIVREMKSCIYHLDLSNMEKINHFIVVDSRHCRIEEKHDPKSWKEGFSSIEFAFFG